MIVKLLTEHYLEFLGLTGRWTDSSESMLSKCHIVGNHMSRLNCGGMLCIKIASMIMIKNFNIVKPV